MHRVCVSNTNDSGLSFYLAREGFHEIWRPDAWQGTSLPNRSDLGEGVGQGNDFPKTRSTEVKGRVGGGIFGNGWSTFLLQKRPSPTLFTGIYKTRINFEIESMTNLLQNDLK